MSIRIMTAVWDSQRYDAGTLLVLLAMADYANDDDRTCHPSIGRLADKSRLSRRQVLRILDRLKSDGVITPVGEHPVRNGSPIVIYRIETAALKGDIDNTKGDTMSPLPPETVANVTLKCDTHDTPGVTPMSHDPLEEPSIGPSEEEGAVPAQPAAAAPTPSAWYEPEPEASAPVTPTLPVPTVKGMTAAPVIAMYRDAFLRYPSKPQMAYLLAAGVTDLRRWQDVLTLWVGKGWGLTNLVGMIDLYQNPERLRELTSYQPPALTRPALHPQAIQRTAEGLDGWLAELSRTDNAHQGAA